MLPRVIVHLAVSADGRIGGFEPDIGLYYSLVREWAEDVTLSTSATMVAAPADEDDTDVPEPPPPAPDDRRALLAVIDSGGRVRSWRSLRESGFWRDALALVTEATPAEHLRYLERTHVRHAIVGRERVDLRAALELLAGVEGAEVVRVDAGGTLTGALLREGLVDEVSLLVHPVLVGGADPLTMFRELTGGPSPISLQLLTVEQHPGGLVRLRYEVER